MRRIGKPKVSRLEQLRIVYFTLIAVGFGKVAGGSRPWHAND